MHHNLNFHFISQKGIKTSLNEDTVCVPTWNEDIPEKCEEILRKGFYFTLSDGMGGHKAGNIASYYCSNWLLNGFYEEDEIKDPRKWIEKKIVDVNKRIYELSLGNEEYKGMGTTVVSLLIKGEEAFIHNVGDSRAYLFTRNKLKQISEDHSLVWNYYKEGLISKNEILESNIKHIITEAIGLKNKPKVNSYKINLPKKFLFLLCSDGLTDVTTDEEIENILKKKDSLNKTTRELYKISQKKGSMDDVSILIVKNY